MREKEAHEKFAEVQQELKTGTLVEGEQTFGRIKTVEKQPYEHASCDALILGIDAEGVRHKAVLPLIEPSQSLPGELSSYPTVDRVTDLPERRVLLKGTGSDLVKISPFPYKARVGNPYHKEEWLSAAIQQGAINIDENGEFEASRSIRMAKRHTGIIISGLSLAAMLSVMLPVFGFPIGISLLFTTLSMALFFGFLLSGRTPRWLARRYGCPTPEDYNF